MDSSRDSQKTNLAASCKIRGPEVAVGVPKALSPVASGTKHCETPVPQSATFRENANCCVRTAVMLGRLKTLKPSQLNSSLARSPFKRTIRVSRRSSETALGNVKVLRPSPGVRSLARLPSLFKSKLRSPEYGCPDWAVRMPPTCHPRRAARAPDGSRSA